MLLLASKASTSVDELERLVWRALAARTDAAGRAAGGASLRAEGDVGGRVRAVVEVLGARGIVTVRWANLVEVRPAGRRTLLEVLAEQALGAG